MAGVTPGSAQLFAELVAARLCHDLSGPLSVIANAAELAKLEQGRAGGEAMALMLEGGQAVAGRVKLLRALFGPPVGPHSVPEIEALVRGALGGGRVEADLSALAPGAVFSPEAARTLLAALCAGAEGLARGGIVRAHGGPEDFAVSLEGPGARWPEHLTAVLAGEDPMGLALGAGARSLMGPWLVLAARAAGLVPSLLMGAGVPLLRLARAAA